MLLSKIRKHGISGILRISLRLLKTALVEISCGARVQDKLALAIRWLLMPFYILLYGKYPYGEFYPFNVILKTPYGLFYCKRGVGDVYAILYDNTPLGKGFKLDIGYLRLDDGVFIDVGANLGKYTIAVARELGNKGMVVAIEPNPDVYERLLLNIKLNRLTNVIPLNVAADSQNRKVHLFVDPVYHGSSSLLTREKGLPFIEVTAKRLDDIISELGIYSGIRLVKIDVEGWEAEVLKGMREILRSCRPKIIFEAWDESHLRDVEEELKEFGYEIRPIAEFNYLALPKQDFNL